MDRFKFVSTVQKVKSLNPGSLGLSKMRLTVSDVPQPPVAGSPAWIRVYRWGDKVGTLRKEASWAERWSVEVRRTLCAETEEGRTVLLESTELLPNESLPLVVDDAWEEEVVPVAEGATWNRAWVASGSSSEIERACAAHRISLSPTLLARLREKPVVVPTAAVTAVSAIIPTSIPSNQSRPLDRIPPPTFSEGRTREGARGGFRGGGSLGGTRGGGRGGRGRGAPSLR